MRDNYYITFWCDCNFFNVIFDSWVYVLKMYCKYTSKSPVKLCTVKSLKKVPKCDIVFRYIEITIVIHQ